MTINNTAQKTILIVLIILRYISYFLYLVTSATKYSHRLYFYKTIAYNLMEVISMKPRNGLFYIGLGLVLLALCGMLGKLIL